MGVTNSARKSVPWRRDLAILARLPEVERLYIIGRPNTVIAQAVGVDEVTVRRDLERLRELWLERIGATQDVMRAQKVAELGDIARRAIAAAEFDEHAERGVIFGKDADGNPIDVERDLKGAVSFRGNKAAALNVARQAYMDQAKLLGLVIDKTDLTSAGKPIKTYIGIDLDAV